MTYKELRSEIVAKLADMIAEENMNQRFLLAVEVQTLLNKMKDVCQDEFITRQVGPIDTNN